MEFPPGLIPLWIIIDLWMAGLLVSSFYAMGRLVGCALFRVSCPPLNVGLGSITHCAVRENALIRFREFPCLVWFDDWEDRWTWSMRHDKLPRPPGELRTEALSRMATLLVASLVVPALFFLTHFIFLQIRPVWVCPMQVKTLIPHGPAERAGLQRGDVILAIDGRIPGDGHQTQRLLERARGRRTTLAVRRPPIPFDLFGIAGESLTFEVTPEADERSPWLLGMTWSPRKDWSRSFTYGFVDAFREALRLHSSFIVSIPRFPRTRGEILPEGISMRRFSRRYDDFSFCLWESLLLLLRDLSNLLALGILVFPLPGLPLFRFLSEGTKLHTVLLQTR